MYSDKDSKEIANAFVKKLNKGEFTSTNYSGDSESNPYHYEDYSFYHDSIKKDFDSVSVSVDKITGKINSFYMTEIKDGIKFESKDKIMTNEMVKQNAIKNSKANLRYFYDFEQN